MATSNDFFPNFNSKMVPSNEMACDYSLTSMSIEQQIGKGQFSSVYKATDKKNGFNIALKRIQLLEMTDLKARLDCIKEIKLLQQLKHPNIINYIASFTEDLEQYIVLELADGGDLAKLIKTCKVNQQLLSEKLIWKYFSEVVSAVEHMHSRRIMHRDIKPANVFLTSQGVAKLGDLGLGRFFSARTKAAHSMVGTPYYMAPERTQHGGYNFKSDIWSLGCLLYEMAALQSPFHGPSMSLIALWKKIEICDYAPIPSEYYSQELKNLIGLCIITNPEQRPNIDWISKVTREMHSSQTSKHRSVSESSDRTV